MTTAGTAREKTSFSAFVLVPRTHEYKEFCVVRDQPRPGYDSLQKFPGGGVEEGETIEEAASKEIVEETSQRIVNPHAPSRILEVHKRFPGKDHAHHDIFFVSGPPLFTVPLRAGSEIAEIWWKTRDEIRKDIDDGKFYPNHTAAFLWYLVRGEFLKTEDEALIASLIGRRTLMSWFVDEKTLVLCYDRECAVCEREEEAEPRERIERLPHYEPVRGEGNTSNSRLLPKPESINGKVKFVFIRLGKLLDEDMILLHHVSPISEEKNKFALPSAEFNANYESFRQGIMEKYGAELAGLLKKNDHYVAVARINRVPMDSFVFEAVVKPHSLNGYPSYLHMTEEDGGDLWEAVAEYNKAVDANERVWINYSWRALAPRRPFVKNQRRNADRAGKTRSYES